MLQVLMSTREVMYEIDALFKRKPYSEMTDLITDNYKIVYFNKKRPMRGSFHGYTSIHLVSLQSLLLVPITGHPDLKLPHVCCQSNVLKCNIL